jgi:hypothetical protein
MTEKIEVGESTGEVEARRLAVKLALKHRLSRFVQGDDGYGGEDEPEDNAVQALMEAIATTIGGTGGLKDRAESFQREADEAKRLLAVAESELSTLRVQRDELLAKIQRFRDTAGVHEGDHEFPFKSCHKCDESYVLAEKELYGE